MSTFKKKTTTFHLIFGSVLTNQIESIEEKYTKSYIKCLGWRVY